MIPAHVGASRSSRLEATPRIWKWAMSMSVLSGASGATVLAESDGGPYIEDLTTAMPITHNRRQPALRKRVSVCRFLAYGWLLRDFQKSISLTRDRGKSIYNCPAPSDSQSDRIGSDLEKGVSSTHLKVPKTRPSHCIIQCGLCCLCYLVSALAALAPHSTTVAQMMMATYNSALKCHQVARAYYGQRNLWPIGDALTALPNC